MKPGIILLLSTLFTIPVSGLAQEKFEVHGQADFVSNYVWRGFDQHSGFSIQPSLTLGYKGFSLNVWGSESLTDGDGAREFDINLNYAYKGFSIMLSDLWWGGKHTAYGYYQGKDGNTDNGHHLELTAAFNGGERFPLTLSWSTWLAGSDAETGDGARGYSTYLNASFRIDCPFGVTLTPAIGFTPWNSYYAQACGTNKACFTDLSVKAAKELPIGERFSLPVYVQAVVNPTSNTDNTFLVAGFALGF